MPKDKNTYIYLSPDMPTRITTLHKLFCYNSHFFYKKLCIWYCFEDIFFQYGICFISHNLLSNCTFKYLQSMPIVIGEFLMPSVVGKINFVAT